jgi:hypothetical protein
MTMRAALAGLILAALAGPALAQAPLSTAQERALRFALSSARCMA